MQRRGFICRWRFCAWPFHVRDLPLTNSVSSYNDSSPNFSDTFYGTHYLHLKKDNRINELLDRKAPTYTDSGLVAPRCPSLTVTIFLTKKRKIVTILVFIFLPFPKFPVIPLGIHNEERDSPLSWSLPFSNSQIKLDSLPKMPLSPSTQKNPTKMLERVLSSRRSASHPDAENDDVAADDSKTKKHLPISFFTTRITNYLTRSGPVWPCFLLLALVLLLIFSLIFNSRRFVCISPYDPVSRTGFFGFDGLESDFGSLGVPWCKYIRVGSHLCKVAFFSDRSEFLLLN